jgi:hypothetical protein
MPTQLPREKLHCNTCLGPRWHSVHFSVKEEHHEEYDGGGSYHEVAEHRVAQCDGCDSYSFHTSWQSSDGGDPTELRWPPKISRREPKWMLDLFFGERISNPEKHDFMREIYSAYTAGNLRLCVIGIRALLEHVMVENITDQGSFVVNLNAFESGGFISRIQREAIEPVLAAGHASMHRGFKASEPQVQALLDVTENILESIYITKGKVKGLEIPPRPSKT